MTAWMDYAYREGFLISREHVWPYRKFVEVPDDLVERYERNREEQRKLQEELRGYWADAKDVR
jgi:hypothetical protein